MSSDHNAEAGRTLNRNAVNDSPLSSDHNDPPSIAKHIRDIPPIPHPPVEADDGGGRGDPLMMEGRVLGLNQIRTRNTTPPCRLSNAISMPIDYGDGVYSQSGLLSTADQSAENFPEQGHFLLPRFCFFLDILFFICYRTNLVRHCETFWFIVYLF